MKKGTLGHEERRSQKQMKRGRDDDMMRMWMWMRKGPKRCWIWIENQQQKKREEKKKKKEEEEEKVSQGVQKRRRGREDPAWDRPPHPPQPCSKTISQDSLPRSFCDADDEEERDDDDDDDRGGQKRQDGNQQRTAC